MKFDQKEMLLKKGKHDGELNWMGPGFTFREMEIKVVMPIAAFVTVSNRVKIQE